MTLQELKDRRKEKQKQLLNIFLSNTYYLTARLSEIEKVILETNTELLLEEICLINERIEYLQNG